MNSNSKINTLYLASGLGLMVIFSRLMPHAPNFTATLAAIIFAAVSMRSIVALFTILLSYLISDLIINNIIYQHNEFYWISPGFIWILIPLIAVYGINKYFFRNSFNPLSIISSSVVSSLSFFIITNFAVWLTSQTLYQKNLSGLLNCYWNALPFFGYEIAGTLFYASVIFSFYWLFFPHYAFYGSRERFQNKF